jgi:hypothetical protein
MVLLYVSWTDANRITIGSIVSTIFFNFVTTENSSLTKNNPKVLHDDTQQQQERS